MGILQRMSNNILLLLLNPEERWTDEKHQHHNVTTSTDPVWIPFVTCEVIVEKIHLNVSFVP